MKKIFQLILLLLALATSSPIFSQAAHTDQIPPEEIKQFVRTIAVIKHYYINKVDDQTLFANAIRGMVANLDPHSSFLGKSELKELKTAVSGKFVGIGVELTTQSNALKVISSLEDTPAERAGIKADDLIIKIDGKLVQDMTLREAVNEIKGKPGTTVSLTIIRKNEKKPISVTVTRNIIKLITVKHKILENGFGYVRITFFQGPVHQLLRNSIEELQIQSNKQLKGLVLDLRNNPGGLLDVSAQVADVFLDSAQLDRYHKLIVYTKGRIKGADMQIKATPGDLTQNIPLVVLINGGSASASEIVAGALQDYKRAVIMGTRSFGKGSVQTVLPVGEDSAIKLTTALYHTPAGRIIQAKGVIPDVRVPELTVSEKEIKGLLNVDETDYRHHLLDDPKNKIGSAKSLKDLSKKELELAKRDYQLYEALMMLKGMSAMNSAHSNL